MSDALTSFSLGGMKIEVIGPTIRKRSLFERLFTRPWRPLVKTVVVAPIVPDGQALRFADRMLMTRGTYDELRRSLDSRP